MQWYRVTPQAHRLQPVGFASHESFFPRIPHFADTNGKSVVQYTIRRGTPFRTATPCESLLTSNVR